MIPFLSPESGQLCVRLSELPKHTKLSGPHLLVVANLPVDTINESLGYI
jgi:hypothetical protein